MGTNLDGFLHDIAQSLRSRGDEPLEQLLQSQRSSFPGIWQDQDLAALTTKVTSQHITTVLDILQYGVDISAVEMPPAAAEFARRAAELGTPLSELLRSDRLSHVDTLKMLYGETVRLTSDPELRDEAAMRLISGTFEYVDRLAEQVVAAYEEARDRRLQRRLTVINEASRRIGTTLDTARTARELAEVGTNHLADFVTVDLLEAVLGDEGMRAEPDPLALRRIAQQSVLEGHPESAVETGQTHSFPEGSESAQTIITGHPLRYRPASPDTQPWPAGLPGGHRAARDFDVHSMLMVPLWARGSPLGLAQFFRHRTADPFDDDDLLLAQEITSRAAVHIDNARRYTLERSTSLTLQRSLLPLHGPQGHESVETAARYVPCGSLAGVGGDWYDVIPLSGARVALVIGDVVGRGLRAAATMGRLRTAVRTLADIDLMPDELLAHLNDVVIRLQHEEEQDADEISATCLYMIYDPISQSCSMAGAGHVAPAVVSPAAGKGDTPQHAVDFPKLSVGPPLGLGGLPFEMTQFEVPEGSLLVLFTDGLIENRTRDVDTGLALLRDVLVQPASTLQSTCDHVLSALQPDRPSDDVALLVARTRALDAEHVGTLDLPSDPEVVAEARDYATGRLAAWGLEDMAFTTELMVSELVTNAIRYGKAPIQLRMILQYTLTCEVSDASSTAPHLRRAHTFDEGGRGLFLVAQLADHWGTRHSREGKVIWAEQSLPA
ncbi:SpoIIE family protein phosphatase [Streptomyces sp. NPDC005373]|uniref:ATP-binding SpoIIE family protein phosphatase n=1 Tax=Streptomyces sp. NPDC005373 TaxID=3156879 RepID=UPI0033B3076A